MATKKALAKAYDAGQAAQRDRVPPGACPFEEGSEERERWMDGHAVPLAEKWQPRAGQRITVAIEDQ